MSFSSFDEWLLAEGLAYFDRPRLALLLEAFGTTKLERVEAMVTMLRNGSDEEFDEAAQIFERAVARVAREREATQEDKPGRRRPSPSAERREQRRRSS